MPINWQKNFKKSLQKKKIRYRINLVIGDYFMSRTYRNLEGINHCALRHPKTSNERKNLIGILQDNTFEEYQISGINHLHHRLSKVPTANYDKVVSGYYQEDYNIA